MGAATGRGVGRGMDVGRTRNVTQLVETEEHSHNMQLMVM